MTWKSPSKEYFYPFNDSVVHHHLSQPPDIHPITKISLPEVVSYTAYNGVPIYEIRKAKAGVVLIELVFAAGRPYEVTKLVATACAALMRQGAGEYTSEVLSEEIDFLGATLSTKATMDFISVKAVCIKKHLSKLIEIISAVISKPHYDKAELDLYKSQNISTLKLQIAKPDISSYRKITEAIYGDQHPYGYNSSEEYYNRLTVEDLRAHHAKWIHADNCHLFVSGDIGDEDRGILEGLCSVMPRGDHRGEDSDFSLFPVPKPEKIHLPGRSHQASIRIGRKSVTRLHEDYYGLNYLVNLLGGYQGSRLISKLREDLGLTYGIYSVLDVLSYDGDMMISTEVAVDKVEESLAAIYVEMERLIEDLVPQEELTLLDNYILGNYLNLFDGPFNSIRGIKSLVLARFPLDKLDTVIQSSVGFDAEYIREMARKYFKRNDFWEVIVGVPKRER